MITKKAFWISYDLGLKGDYSGFYTWLDTVKAKECGDSIAFFTKENKYNENLIEDIVIEIKKYVNLSKTDRVYLIYLENISGKVKGYFLFGGRKRAPWEGFAAGIHGVDEDFE